MTDPRPVYCETAELVVETSALAQLLGLVIAPELTADPLGAAAHAAARTAGPVVAVCLRLPEVTRLIAALDVCSSARRIVLAALSDRRSPVRGLAGDLGLVCVDDVGPALSALALLAAGADGSVRATRKLSSADRARLELTLSGEKGAGRLVSLGAEGVGLEREEPGRVLRLGAAHAIATAIAALKASEPVLDAPAAVQAPALGTAREVLFGPPRVLSGPASKLALGPFGLPLPQEELCTSPSRAAAEAARIGFPVRISLASPDLRVWDHPDLSVDGVDNAARVRDVYRQLTNAAEERARDARVLGVTVTATTLARALTRVSARPLPSGRVMLSIGFADPHGAVSKDATVTVMPQSPRALERALMRLEGHRLILGEGPRERARSLEVIGDLCTRVATFVNAFRAEVLRVELHPVALLVGGGCEIREAAVEVTDAFVRELERSP